MAVHQHATIGDTIYVWFGSNDTSGSGDDGAAAASDVRLAGAAAGAAPVFSPAPTLLTHANYPDGCYEVAVAATVGNGFAAGNTYGVFCTLTVDAQNPTGFVGSFTLAPIIANVMEISDDSAAADNLETACDGGAYNVGGGAVVAASVTGNVGGNVVGSVASVVGAVGSVTGAVGSVTGNVGGNVVGSVASVVGNLGGNVVGNINGNVTGSVGSVVGAVGSVTGAVGSVTGNVGGNVAGSVDSVTTRVTANTDQIEGVDATDQIRDSVLDDATRFSGGDIDQSLSTTESNIRGADGDDLKDISDQIDGLNDPAVGAIADAVWDEAAGGHLTIGTFGQRLNLTRAGTAQAGAVGSITLDAGASAVNDFYDGQVIFLTGGTGAYQSRRVDTYTGATKVVAVSPNWGTAPDNTTEFVLIPEGDVPGATAPTVGQIADAVWDEGRGGHVGAGTFGQGATSVQGNVTGSVGSVTGNVGGNVTGSVASVVGNVGGNVVGTVASVVGNLGGDVVGNVQGDVQGNVDGSVASVVGAVGSVTGAVGSVTGNLGGNVIGNVQGDVQGNVDGSVASVTGNVAGSVASVVGNVGGNVTGSVGSVGANGINAASIAANAIDADALAASAATEIADATLGRNLAAVAAPAVRSLLEAARFLRNRWRIAAGTLTVYEEDDVTPAWTAAVNTAVSDPVDEIDPA